MDDSLGRGEPDLQPKTRDSSEQRPGELQLQESSFVYVGVELAQESDFSATLTQDEFARNLNPLPTPTQL